MEITEVRIKLMEEAGERLQAFCSITFDDCFVIRDLKIIEGANGPFVAMPSRKLTAHCPQCGCKNHLRAAYCNQCGLRLKEARTTKDEEGRSKLYADIAHPINSTCREMIQLRVIREFHEELDRAKQPGYVSRYDDFDHEEVFAQPHLPARAPRREPAGRPPAAAPQEREVVYERPGSEPASQVQPAEPQPRAPHKPQPVPSAPTSHAAPARSSSNSSPAADPAKSGDFGAGIF